MGSWVENYDFSDSCEQFQAQGSSITGSTAIAEGRDLPYFLYQSRCPVFYKHHLRYYAVDEFEQTVDADNGTSNGPIFAWRENGEFMA